MYFCEDPSGEYKTAMCFYPGEITEKSNDYEIEDKTLIAKFSNADEDLYKVFVSNDLVGHSIGYIADLILILRRMLKYIMKKQT